ncbi:MAG: hypothetical protein AAGA85_06685 [Bacteroidota bacterium]
MENQIFQKMLMGVLACLLFISPLVADTGQPAMPHFSGYFEMEDSELVYYPTRVEWYFVRDRQGEIVGLNFVLPYEDVKRSYRISERKTTKKGEMFVCGATSIFWDKRENRPEDEPLITIFKTEESKLPLHKRTTYKAFSADESYASDEAQVRIQKPR